MRSAQIDFALAAFASIPFGDTLRIGGREIHPVNVRVGGFYRAPTARDLAARRRALPSASLYAHTFGSLANALREAGFEVLQGEERLERAA